MHALIIVTMLRSLHVVVIIGIRVVTTFDIHIVTIFDIHVGNYTFILVLVSRTKKMNYYKINKHKMEH